MTAPGVFQFRRRKSADDAAPQTAKNRKNKCRPKTARDDGPEREQPQAIEYQMRRVGMQEHITDERDRTVEQASWIKCVRRIAQRDERVLIHDMFGDFAAGAKTRATMRRDQYSRSAQAPKPVP